MSGYSDHAQNFAQTWTLLPYGRSPPDTVEFVQENDTVYLAQPSLSEFTPGGSGFGTFNANQTASISLRDNPNATLALLMDEDPSKNGMGEILRCALSIYYNSVSFFFLIFVFSGILSGESGFIARSCLTLRLTCEETFSTLLELCFLILFLI